MAESRVTLATSVPILVFLGLSVLELFPMYANATDRRQTASSLNAAQGAGIIKHKWNTSSRQQSLDAVPTTLAVYPHTLWFAERAGLAQR